MADRKRELWLIAIAVVALLARLPVLTVEPAENPDTPLYMGIAERLLHGPDDPGARPLDTTRTPGYPVVLALFQLFPGEWSTGSAIAQATIGIALAVAVAWLGWRWFGAVVGALAGLLVAISPLMVHVERVLTPDFLFGVVLFAGAALLAEAVSREEPSLALLAAAGGVFGLASYLKPNAGVLILAGVIPLAIVTRNWRATLKGSAVVAVACALVFVPWIARNWIAYDYPSMSSIGGVTLFLKAFDQDGLTVPTDSPEGRLARRAREEALKEGAPPTVLTDYAVLAALQEDGRTFQDAADVERDLALDAIRDDPGPYLSGTWENFRHMFQDLGSADFAKDVLEGDADKSGVPLAPSLGEAVWRVGQWASRLWAILCIGGLLCLALPFLGHRRARAAGAALLSVWLLNAVVTSGTTWTAIDPRFAAQGAPVMLLAGVAAIAGVIATLVTRVRPQ